MKKVLLLTGLLILAGTAWATPYQFQGVMVDVDAWVGTGANESILVIDWNKLDNEAGTVSESHAFGYRWDGTKYVSDMLNDFSNAGILTVSTSYGGAFLSNIGYIDPAEPYGAHMHIEEGSWNLASTSNPYARWGSWGDSEWDFNQAGMTQELLANGQFEGINAILFFGQMPAYANDQLDIPMVIPEPVTIVVLTLGAVGLVLRRRHSA
jgi:hypothetical protein